MPGSGRLIPSPHAPAAQAPSGQACPVASWSTEYSDLHKYSDTLPVRHKNDGISALEEAFGTEAPIFSLATPKVARFVLPWAWSRNCFRSPRPWVKHENQIQPVPACTKHAFAGPDLAVYRDRCAPGGACLGKPSGLIGRPRLHRRRKPLVQSTEAIARPPNALCAHA